MNFIETEHKSLQELRERIKTNEDKRRELEDKILERRQELSTDELLNKLNAEYKEVASANQTLLTEFTSRMDTFFDFGLEPGKNNEQVTN